LFLMKYSLFTDGKLANRLEGGSSGRIRTSCARLIRQF
jgi:hypothetical protein